tara:strand:+ start:312 stop:641 length:330 start_codon:yes stop_codon:yes gene_type:complete
MKKLLPLLSVLFLISFGFGQKVYEVIETYDNGSIKKIEYHQLIDDKIGLLKVVNFMKMDLRKKNYHIMNGEYLMDYRLNGTITDKSKVRESLIVVMKMDYGNTGIKMER